MEYRGIAYYPEVWGRERWEEDLRLMKNAEINIVRIGEFAWGRLEPREGIFDFVWLKEFMERVGEADIAVMACTPSAAYPAWMYHNYPDVRAVSPRATEYGVEGWHGLRRHYCHNSPVYRKFVRRIVEKLADTLAPYQNVCCWQIDNELAPPEFSRPNGSCVCPVCMDGFRNWLQKRYGSLSALNEAWGTGFWCIDYSDWDQITSPPSNRAWIQDYATYQSEQYADFAAFQYQILKERRADWIVTANISDQLGGFIDHAEMFEALDVVAYDAYMGIYESMDTYVAVYDAYRNLKPGKPFWIAETGSQNMVNTDKVYQRMVRVWAFQAIAHGCGARFNFRWRNSVMGEEGFGVLDWSGRPGPLYEEVKTLNRELKALTLEFSQAPLPQPRAAILMDNGVGYALDQLVSRGQNDFVYHQRLTEVSALLNRRQCPADILAVRQNHDLSKYKLVVLPLLEMVSDALADKLRTYVMGGGILLATPRLAIKDRNGKYLTCPRPAGLTSLFGIDVILTHNIHSRPRMSGPLDEFSREDQHIVPIELEMPGVPQLPTAMSWMEQVELAGEAIVLGRYRAGQLEGQPVLIEHPYGEGKTLYMASWLDLSSYQAVVDYAMQEAGISFDSSIPSRVEVVRRGNLIFYINHRLEPITIFADHDGEALVGEFHGGLVHLAPADVCVIKT